MDRRSFIKSMAAAGGIALLNPMRGVGNYGLAAGNYFEVHNFIENNPDAVFIMRTQVDNKFDAAAIKQAGLDFGQSVFITSDNAESGIPLDHIFAIKPNLTGRGKWYSDYTIEGTMGVITDANFVEGVIESMKGLGISADHISIREVNGVENMTEGGYGDMAARTGADVQILNQQIGTIIEDKVQWRDLPNGVWFNKIPYLWPINADNSWLLNISKFKAHSMGLTLCAKNLQGSIVANYQQHCKAFYTSMDISSDHVQSNAWSVIQENYNRHVADGIPRWDTLGWTHQSGLGQETWITRCLDNNSVTKPGLHVIEGVYGRDGHFVVGPHDELAQDFMTNIIIFGKNAFHVDIIGHWLGGHEPGNFGLFHIAKERGFSSLLNPMDIPVYEWKADGSATRTPLTDFERTPLKTYYLQLDGEDYWHLCDEPYDYPTTAIANNQGSHKPESFILHQNYPNPFNPSTTIQFNLNRRGFVRLELFNTLGERVDVLVDGHYSKGSHMVLWNRKNVPSGTYFYRLSSNSFSETKKMILQR